MKQRLSTYLRQLEAESIHIMREVAAEFRHPVMLYSIGKDSSVMLHLAMKAFYPGEAAVPAAPCRHHLEVPRDDRFPRQGGEAARRRAHGACQRAGRARRHLADHPWQRALYRHHEDARPEAGARRAWQFDAAFGGARRDEEKSRAKERVFSFRNAAHELGPEAAAAGAVASRQYASEAGRKHAGVSAVELDRARRVDLYLSRGHSGGAALFRGRAAGGRARAAC